MQQLQHQQHELVKQQRQGMSTTRRPKRSCNSENACDWHCGFGDSAQGSFNKIVFCHTHVHGLHVGAMVSERHSNARARTRALSKSLLSHMELGLQV